MKPPLASLCALCLLSVAPPLSAQAAQPAPTPVPAVLSLSHATGALSFALPGEPARRVEPGDQTYGSPKLYVSLSVTGWEPFKAK